MMIIYIGNTINRIRHRSRKISNRIRNNNYHAINEYLRIIRNHEDLVGTIFFLNKDNHSSLLDYLDVDYD